MRPLPFLLKVAQGLVYVLAVAIVKNLSKCIEVLEI